MSRGRISALAATLSAGIVLAVLAASPALGGEEPDPDTGDQNLGTSVLRYSSDGEPFDLMNDGYASSIAGCGPDDRHIVGGGVHLVGPDPEEAVASTWPYDWTDADDEPEDGWRASGRSAVAGTLETFAICKSEPQPDYLGGEVANSASSVRLAEQGCGGGTVFGGGGFIATTGSYLTQSYPIDKGDANSKPEDGWAIKLYDTQGGAGVMHIRAVCGNGNASYKTEKKSFQPGEDEAAVAGCPSGTHVSGGGAKVSGPGAEVSLGGTFPYDDNDPNTTPDDGWRASGFNDSAENQKLTTYAICLD